jgi:hypothetical protein
MKNKTQLTELHRLFTIKHGNKFDLNKMEQCSPSDAAIAFVGRSGENNGLVGFVRRYGGQAPFNSGLITVALGGAALSSFVQAKPFYTAQNIDVLEPIKAMSLDGKLFYCLCIEANIFRYSTFGREANRTLKNLLVPMLDCVPDWVDGIVVKAVEDLGRDLRAAIEL